MDLESIKKHWENWAQEFKTDIRATTKTRTIKELEISAFFQVFKDTPFYSKTSANVLEVGCGNGHNCFHLSELIPHFSFTGVDYIADMVFYANEHKANYPKYKNVEFFEGNVLTLDKNVNLKSSYDIIFTDRCLINLNESSLQEQAFDQLYDKLAHSGFIVMIENVQQPYGQQNELRESVGLPKRTPDKFNLFIDETSFIAHAKRKMSFVGSRDFASLHDIVLYVLVPLINNGNLDYEHPFIKATTQLLLSNPLEVGCSFGGFGQNRMYIFKKD